MDAPAFHVRRLVAPRRPPTFSAPAAAHTVKPFCLGNSLFFSFFLSSSFFPSFHFNSRECPSLSRKLCNSLAKLFEKKRSSSRIRRERKEKKISRDSRHRIHPHPQKYKREEILDLSIRARMIYIYIYTSARNIKTMTLAYFCTVVGFGMTCPSHKILAWRMPRSVKTYTHARNPTHQRGKKI